MDINNKQDLADLLNFIDGYNATNVCLPMPTGRKNSENDSRICTPSWWDEFYDYYEANSAKFIGIHIDGAWLVGCNLFFDRDNIALVILSYDSSGFDGCCLTTNRLDTDQDLISAWLGNTSLSDHEYHCVHAFAKKIGYLE